MPHSTNTGQTPAKKPQTKRHAAHKQTGKAPAPAPTPTPAPVAESLFDGPSPAPPAAEQQPVEIARPGDASAVDRPDGDDGEQGATPATPVADEQPASTDASAEDVREEPPLDPSVEMPDRQQGQMNQAGAEASPFAATDPATDKAREEAEKEAAKQSSRGPETVQLGQVTGLLHCMSLGSVMSYAEPFAEKIETLKSSAAVKDLKSKMRMSEGRCAPIYFIAGDDGEPKHLLAGDDALAAAKVAGIDNVYVILVHPRDAGAAQAYLSEKAAKASVSTEDDELVWRAHHEAS